jgi:hypothetical protein
MKYLYIIKKLVMRLFLLFIFFGLNLSYYAQEKVEPIKRPFYIGFGLGMDFGGVGGKLEYMFLDYAGLFTGVGYNFYGFGFNGGVMLKAMPSKDFSPYLSGMYGYTGVVSIENASEYDRIDYGFSLGGGLEFKTKHQNVWQIGIVKPFRSQEFLDHYQDLVDNPDIQISASLRPIAFSIGFKMVIH